MNSDPMGGLLVSLALLSLPVLVILWIAYIISATSSLSKIRDHAKYQTQLLEQLVKNTSPPPDPTKKLVPSSIDYIRDDNKSGAGTVLLILSAVVAVLVIFALVRK